MKAPVILGGLFLVAGLAIHANLTFFTPDQTSIFGFDVIDAEDHRNQVLTAMWSGVAVTLEVCGVLVLVFLSRIGTVPKVKF